MTNEKMAAVVLAAGAGKRMGSAETHKVCFPVAGVPAINRMVGGLRSEGADTVVVVVGALAGDVVRTVGETYPETLFALQRQQRGTGDAARAGFAPLEQLGFGGPVLVTMGDKIVAPGLFRRLKEEFYRTQSDVVFVVNRKSPEDQGRVAVAEDGTVQWLMESADIERLRFFGRLKELASRKPAKPVRPEELRKLAEEVISSKSKLEAIVGPAVLALMNGEESVSAKSLAAVIPEGADVLRTADGELSGDEAARRGRFVNESVYLLRGAALSEGLSHLTSRTAQGEQYLPDVVSWLLAARDNQGNSRFKVRAMVLDEATDIVGFNTPDQLVAVEAVVASREKKATVQRQAASLRPMDVRTAKTAAQWLKLFADSPPALGKALVEIYGTDETLLAERRKMYVKVLQLFIKRYGAQREVVISRSPGRINLLGRHVEHRGGYINTMAINREMLVVASPREDDLVRVTNVDRANFPDRQFHISQELAAVPWEDWLSYINSRRVQQMVLDARGDWINYVKAGVLRLQQSFRDVKLLGMDAAVIGDIPMAAGLSSSSAIVVATGEASIACNRLDVTASDFVDLCGEGEWYVGSRGGAGDHAAMKFGRRARVSRVRFFPFAFEYVAGIPDSHRLVVFNSQIKAQKSASAKDVFNQKVASYEFGLMMILDRHPHYAHLIDYLRDLNPERLHVRPHVIYDMLLTLPQAMTREELRTTLSAGHREKAERIFQTHQEPTAYDIRSVMLYGVGEMARSERFGQLLSEGRLVEAGRMMSISHDGDRVSRLGAHGRMLPHDYLVSDGQLRALVGDLQSELPDRVERAQLYNQAGGYACSVPEIDRMVDVALGVEGVLGAQLSGAGLGGCMMVLCEAGSVEKLKRRMARDFYKPHNLAADATVCQPIEGSGLLAV